MKIKSMLLGTAAAAFLTFTASSAMAQEAKQSAFQCEPGELYAMNVMVSGVEYWFPVYEMFKQAAQQMGCETVYTGTRNMT